MVYLTRKEHFNGAHRIYNPQWSKEKNETAFGKCANANWHGHNFELYVTVKGEPNPDTGFIINAHDLSRLLKKEVLEKLDHKNFNLDVPDLQGVIPSTENLAKVIWNWINPHLKAATLHCIKLVETENIYVEYFGE